jgi:acyl dehydratase
MAEWPIGRTWDGGVFPVRAEATQAYADATDDPNPAYRGSAAVAPPMFHTRAFIDLMMTLARAPELGIDLLRLVHGEHSMRFVRPLRPGDDLALQGELVAVSPKSSGTVYTFALRARRDAELVLDGRTSYFVRGESKPSPGGTAPGAAAVAKEPEPTADFVVDQRVSSDQADRYARASGDHNPIHLDGEVARKAGLPGVILHGLCTLAFAQRDLIDRVCAGDPSRLAALSVRFAGPVVPGDTLRMSVWQSASSARFSTVDGQGRPVLSHGLAELR